MTPSLPFLKTDNFMRVLLSLLTWDRQGSESYEADRNTAKGTTVFNIRYRSGITAKMRVVYQGGWYDIFSVKAIGRKKELEIAADFKDNEVVT